jgi:formyl-CoA transferase
VPKQAGNNHPTSIPTGVFETRDGYINIATTGQKIWERFCRAIGAEELISNPDYTNSKARSDNRDRLNAEIAAKLRQGPSNTWIKRLNEAGVPCGHIYSIDQVFSDPQVQHLKPQATIDSPHVGKLTLLKQPMTLSRTPSHMERYPPAVGEHTREVLREAGFAPDEIAELAREGIV